MSTKLLHKQLKIIRQRLTELEKRLSQKEQQLAECEQTKAVLEHSEKKYQQILDAIADPVCIQDSPSGMVWANKAFRDYYGLGDQQLTDFPNTSNNDSLAEAVKFPLLNAAGQPYALCSITDIRRQQAHKRLLVQQGTAQVLSAATTMDGAIPKLLESICQGLEWDLGEFWVVDQTANVLRCLYNWQVPSAEISQFCHATQQYSFALGQGLPGRVWMSGKPVWITDILTHLHFYRKRIAVGAKLHSAIAVPVSTRGQIWGVLCFYCRNVQKQDEELLAMMVAIGNQIGHFIERQQTELALKQAKAELEIKVKQRTIDLHQMVEQMWQEVCNRTIAEEKLQKSQAELNQMIEQMWEEVCDRQL